MAQTFNTPINTAGSKSDDRGQTGDELHRNDAANAEDDAQANRSFFAKPAGVITILVLAIVIAGAAYFAWKGLGSSSANANNKSGSAATPAAASSPSTAATLSPAEIKEMQARDDYATKISKELRVRVPAYKNVGIYANSWAGAHAPAKTPLTDIKARTGDNLMLVFWSPDAGTAKGLADFTKSKAARDAVDAGFAEFQFVDPDTYCYAQATPTTGVGAVTCGIR